MNVYLKTYTVTTIVSNKILMTDAGVVTSFGELLGTITIGLVVFSF